MLPLGYTRDWFKQNLLLHFIHALGVSQFGLHDFSPNSSPSTSSKTQITNVPISMSCWIRFAARKDPIRKFLVQLLRTSLSAQVLLGTPEIYSSKSLGMVIASQYVVFIKIIIFVVDDDDDDGDDAGLSFRWNKELQKCTGKKWPLLVLSKRVFKTLRQQELAAEGLTSTTLSKQLI